MTLTRYVTCTSRGVGDGGQVVAEADELGALELDGVGEHVQEAGLAVRRLRQVQLHTSHVVTRRHSKQHAKHRGQSPATPAPHGERTACTVTFYCTCTCRYVYVTLVCTSKARIQS